MTKFVICWSLYVHPYNSDVEWYDTREEADTALAKFQEKFPWNRYFLCEVVKVVEPTKRHEDVFPPKTFTYSQSSK